MTGLRTEELDYLAPYFDVAKIGWGLPLLVARDRLKERIELYHRHEIRVSTGGELFEYAVSHDRVPQFLDEARTLGFDQIVVSSGSIELPADRLDRYAEDVRRRALGLVIEVGRNDPQRQLSLRETVSSVAHARTLRPYRVALASRESGRGVGIYGPDGTIKWDWVRAVLAEHPQDELLFEAPLEVQQVQLLRELGPDVNLGSVAIEAVAPLATDRLGLRGEPFGPAKGRRSVAGPPAAKFLYFLLESYRSLDQPQMVELSRMPRRTVQSGLDSLRRQGLVLESISLHDSRRREYRLA